MRKNRLGQSDLYVSEIGLGCMSLGTDEAKAISIVHEALDQGINFVDTADLYDEARNEEIIGKAIRQRRQDVILTTKVGNRRILTKKAGAGILQKPILKMQSKIVLNGCKPITSIYTSCMAALLKIQLTKRLKLLKNLSKRVLSAIMGSLLFVLM